MRGEIASIVAGYPDNMHEFLESNPCFKFRINETYFFNDFAAEQLNEIALGSLNIENLVPDELANIHMKQYFTFLFETKDTFFGNARTVTNFVEETEKNQQLRMAEINVTDHSKQMMEALNLKDVEEFRIKSGLQQCNSEIGFKLTSNEHQTDN